jgi:hypothetical protein
MLERYHDKRQGFFSWWDGSNSREARATLHLVPALVYWGLRRMSRYICRLLRYPTDTPIKALFSANLPKWSISTELRVQTGSTLACSRMKMRLQERAKGATIYRHIDIRKKPARQGQMMGLATVGLRLKLYPPPKEI